MHADDLHNAISPIEEIIEAARDGNPYILVDAEARENEGDIIIPAQFATPAQINFMARHARGLICLAMTEERAKKLRLPPMVAENNSGHRTAFTISIEAREGVTTGISAQDRAHTVAVAIDATKDCDDIVSPGHVFPLVAKPGGVLVRAGHTAGGSRRTCRPWCGCIVWTSYPICSVRRPSAANMSSARSTGSANVTAQG